jgi:hypothetical protein
MDATADVAPAFGERQARARTSEDRDVLRRAAMDGLLAFRERACLSPNVGARDALNP